MELREYGRACRRRWMWLVVPMLLAAGIAAGVVSAREPAYRSSMMLFVTTGADDPDAGASRLNSYLALLTGPRVVQRVVAEVGAPLTAEDVRRSLSAQVQEGTDLLVVSATDPSAERSRAIVRSAARELVALVRRLQPPTEAAGGEPAPSVSVAQDAVTVAEPDGLVRDAGFAAVLGLLVGAVAVAVREATRRTVAEEDDLRRLGIGTVGTIAIGGRGRGGHPDRALAEAFRRLRSLLPEPAALRRDGARGTALLLTGTRSKEGTTAVACGLAIAMAETGARVVLVDANLRRPGVSRYLAMADAPGLAEVLSGRAAVAEVLRDPLAGRLTVLPPGEGPPDPGELLASPALGATVRELTGRFDVVLVDGPPLDTVADAAVLGKVTDGTLLVVRAHRTSTAEVHRSTDLLERTGARLVGAVLNALPRRLPGRPPVAPATAVRVPPDDGLLTTLAGTDESGDRRPAPARGQARVEPAHRPADDRDPSD